MREMALDYSKGRNKTLSAIAEKQNTAQTVVNIPVDKIVENEQNAAIFDMTDIDELANEISENGFHGAIEVIRKKEGNYEIISGHRRFRALKLNGVKEIPCIILDVDDTDDEKKLRLLITSNVFNREISPLSLAKAINVAEKRIFSKQKGDTRKALAEFFNKSESQIHKYKVLVNLIPELQELLEKKILSYSSLSEIAVKSEEEQKKYYDIVMEHIENDELTISPAKIKEKFNNSDKQESDINEPDEPVSETEEKTQPVAEQYEDGSDEETTVNGSDDYDVQQYEEDDESDGSDGSEEPETDDIKAQEEKNESEEKFKKFLKKNYFDLNDILNQCKSIGYLQNDDMKLLIKLQTELTNMYKSL